MINILKNMTSRNGCHVISVLSVAVMSAVMSGCTLIAKNEAKADSHHEKKLLSFIAFGDTGYDYTYLEKKDVEPPLRTLAEFQEKKRRKWIKKGYSDSNFVEFPAYFHKPSGSYVDSSGLMVVANQMFHHCESAGCNFGVMLGDNIYPDGATLGQDGFNDDERFSKLFVQPYGRFSDLSPEFKIYVTLGNHDWNTSREGALAQLSFVEKTPPFYMDGLYYSVKPEDANGEVELFVVDTEMLLSTTMVYEDKLNKDGTEAPTTEISAPKPWTLPRTEKERQMLEWLNKEIANSTASWKIVIGHHPIWSSGGSKFTQARALRKLIMPTLCRYADAYIAGHEHTLEVHEDDCSEVGIDRKERPLVEIVSGAGAKQRGVNQAFANQQSLNNPQLNSIYAKGMLWGYAYIELTGKSAKVDLYSIMDDAGKSKNLELSYTFFKR